MLLHKVIQNLSLFTFVTLAINASAAQNIYVSPKGSDTSGKGTKSEPYKTVQKAKSHVRKLGKLKSNVNVILKSGTYYLKDTLKFTKKDSGRNGYTVTYKSEKPLAATLSAGMPIKGWSDNDGDGIWEANVPTGSDSRQLYVDGKRAVRARSVNGAGWGRNASGYGTPAGVDRWQNPEDIELVFGFRWKMNRGKVKSVNGRQATMEPGFFKGSALGPFGLVDQRVRVAWVENNLALLDQPGEWYLDKKKNKLYYKPLAGHKLTGHGSAKVVLPRHDAVIAGLGVSNLRFEGLQFRHATWLRPNKDIGYISVQAGVTMDNVDFESIEDAFDGLSATPGNVRFYNSRKIVFAGNKFTNLGAAGLSFDKGSKYNTIFNNHFTDISASAVIIANPMDHHPVNPNNVVKDTLIDNNLVEKVSVEFDDNPAIISLYAERTVITNNTIKNVPYSGISVGWGWGRYDVDEMQFTTDNTGKAYNSPTVLQETYVMNNYIENLMLIRHDGGGIYNLSSNINSIISGNVITGAHDLNGAVYLDDGSRGFQVNKNVSFKNRGPRINEHVKHPEHHTVVDNDWSGRSPNYNPSYKSVVEAAGRKESIRERSIKQILSTMVKRLDLPASYLPPEKGLILGKSAKASSNSAHAKYAIDGNAGTYWFAGKGQHSGELIVDLKSNHALDHVALAFGTLDKKKQYQYIKRNIKFTVQFSEDGQNWSDVTVFTQRGHGKTRIRPTKIVTTVQAINDLLIQGPKNTRFVKIKVLDSSNQDFGILRLKVVGKKL